MTTLVKYRHYHPNLPLVLLKHHTYVNFTNLGEKPPTYINVVRHPVNQFSSFYYFQRYGWGLLKGKRKAFAGSQADRQRTMDQCVQFNHPECADAIGLLNKYFCGSEPICQEPRYRVKVQDEHGEYKLEKRTDWDKIAKATEQSKINIIRDYHAIGILGG